MNADEIKAETKRVAIRKLEVLQEQLAEIFMELPVGENVHFDPQGRAQSLISAAINGIESV